MQPVAPEPNEPALAVQDGADGEGDDEGDGDGPSHVIPGVVGAVDFVRAELEQGFAVPLRWAVRTNMDRLC